MNGWTPTRVAIGIGLGIAALIAMFLMVQEAKSSPWQIALVTPVPADAATVDTGTPGTDVNPPTEPEPPTSGTSVGYAGYSRTPRAQTADLAVIAHHVAVPVSWALGENAETTFRWPSADADWVGTMAYRWLAFPAPPGHPNTPDGFETQHAVNLNGQRYEVLISETALIIAAELQTLSWTTVAGE